MAKPQHKPTDEQRKTVRAMCAYGIPQAKICAVIGITEPTLRLRYAQELDTAEAEANTVVAQSLFNMATKEKNVAAAIFWLKTRARWREEQIPGVNVGVNVAAGGGGQATTTIDVSLDGAEDQIDSSRNYQRLIGG